MRLRYFRTMLRDMKFILIFMHSNFVQYRDGFTGCLPAPDKRGEGVIFFRDKAENVREKYKMHSVYSICTHIPSSFVRSDHNIL